MANSSSPRFTIILPCYNGGDYLISSVQSVLTQTYEDFELVLLDDASTDGSLDWLRSLNDRRVRLYPTEQNLGIVGNWRRALYIPKGEFMTVLGQDDLFDNDFLATIDALVNENPDASLYHAHFRFINENGELIAAARPLPAKESAAEYVAALFSGVRDTYATGYVFRSELHDALGGFPVYPNLFFADDVFWISTMSQSYKATASNECFSCRRHSNSLSATNKQWAAWIDAMIPYAKFLTEKGQQNPAFKDAVDKYGYDYLLQYCRVKYLDGLVQETKQNRKIDPSYLQKMEKALALLKPQQSVSVNDGFKGREIINQFGILRYLYNLYISRKY